MVRYYEYIPRMELHNREAGSTKLFSYDYARMTIRGDTDTGISTYHLTMLRNAWVDQYLHQIGDILYESSVPIPGQDPIACIITDVVATNGGQVYEIDAVSVASVLQRTQSQLQLTNTTSAAIVQALAAEAGYHYYHYGGTSRNYAEWDSRGIPVWDAVRRFCAGENCYASIYNNNYSDPTMSYSPPRHTLVVRPVPSTSSATLTTGHEIISEPEWSEDDKNIVNDLVLQCKGFTRSFADSSAYRDTASAAKYGLCSRRISRLDIDNTADADAFAAGVITKLATPKTVCKATVASHTHSYAELGNEYVIVRPHAIGELYTVVDEINGRTQNLLLKSYNYDSNRDVYEATFAEPNVDLQAYINDQSARINDLENQVGKNILSGDVSSHHHSADRDLANSTGALTVGKGGTGQTSLTSGSFLKGNGTGAVALRTPAQVLSDIGAAPADTLQKAYPVGAIYISTKSTSPAALFGFGTWAAFAQGRVMVGVGTSDQAFAAGATGGASNHILTAAQMPGHTHPFTPSGTVGAHQHSVSMGMGGAHTHDIQGYNPGGQMPDRAQVGGGTQANGIKTGGVALSAGSHNHSTSVSNVAPSFTGTAGTTGSTGSGGGHNNLQPYIVVYMWERTA
jgi:microcystin-dependent protein